MSKYSDGTIPERVFIIQADHMRFVVDAQTGQGVAVSPSGKNLDEFQCEPGPSGQHTIVSMALGVQEQIDRHVQESRLI
jgi:hypothetical protein